MQKFIAHFLQFSSITEDKIFSCIIPRHSYDENKDLKFQTANRILEKLRYENVFNSSLEYMQNVDYDRFIRDISSDDLSVTQGLCTEYSDEKPNEEIIFSSSGSLKEYNEYLKKSMKEHEREYPQSPDEVLPSELDNEI